MVQFKNNMKRVTQFAWKRKWSISGLLGLLLISSYGGLYACVSVQQSNTSQFVNINESKKLAYYVHEPDIEAQVQSPQVRQPVILIHGTPTDATSWNKLIAEIDKHEDASRYSVIVVDRLGFGRSTDLEVIDLKTHADSIIALIDELPEKPIIVGHSYGGPVALKIATMIPEQIDAAVIVAGACDPYMQDSVWFREMVDSAGVLVPDEWSKGNAELLALTKENQEMEPELVKVTSPVVVIHGTWDPVCPYEGTVDYLQTRLVNSDVNIIKLEREGHNIHLTQPKVIIDAIQKYSK